MGGKVGCFRRSRKAKALAQTSLAVCTQWNSTTWPTATLHTVVEKAAHASSKSFVCVPAVNGHDDGEHIKTGINAYLQQQIQPTVTGPAVNPRLRSAKLPYGVTFPSPHVRQTAAAEEPAIELERVRAHCVLDQPDGDADEVAEATNQ